MYQPSADDRAWAFTRLNEILPRYLESDAAFYDLADAAGDCGKPDLWNRGRPV